MFVNEYVSEPDIAKHNLDALHKQFSPWAWRDGRPSVFRHAWVIDRERDTFLVPLCHIEELGTSGRSESTTKQIFFLTIRGNAVRIVLDRSEATSASIHDKPFRKVWRLIELHLTEDSNILRMHAIQLLKEALTVYGLAGIHHQIPDTIVEFEF